MNIIVPAALSDGISETTDLRVAHEPWCTEHVDPSPEVGERGWCSTQTETHGVSIEIASDVDTLDGQPGIELYAPSDTWLTAQQLREVATAWLAAADQLDPLTRDKAIEFMEQIGFDHTDEAMAALGFTSRETR